MIRPAPDLSTGQPSRRALLRSAACGFGYLALADLASARAGTSVARSNPLAPRTPLVRPRAQRVIFIFMQGGPSHVDTFDPKPRLDRDHGKTVELFNARHRTRRPERLMASPWKFTARGQCGAPVSELFPHIAQHVDDLCFIKSLHTEGVAHGPATLQLHTGATNLVRPAIGAWIAYGLGTESRNLPAFVTINPTANMGGSRLYANAFLPAIYQGTAIGRAGLPTSQATIRHLTNDRLPHDRQRAQLEFLQSMNQVQLPQGPRDELEAVIHSYELAFRMQQQAPRVLDLSDEPAETLDLYGVGREPTDNFGRQCLMARRLAEAGVRFIQINYSDNSPNPMWDQHSNLPQHAQHARATDQPVAGLLADLKRRGLLEETLVWWGAEFGRTPFAENGGTGRDHNPGGFTVFLAGGGVRGGMSYGATDEFGYNAVENPVHMYDLHATILHLLGLDHEKLTYRYAGRDFRLTDVHGEVVRQILS